MGDPARVVERFVESGRDPVQAELLRRELIPLHQSLRPNLLHWLRTDEIDRTLHVKGYSIGWLLDEMWADSVPTALTFLDGLIRFPSETLELLCKPRHGGIGVRKPKVH